MDDRRCAVCGNQVPADADYCPVDGVFFTAPVALKGAVLAGEPSLSDAALYERVEKEPEQPKRTWAEFVAAVNTGDVKLPEDAG